MKIRNRVTGEVREAEIRCYHAASSYGIPVLVLKNCLEAGQAIDAIWWEEVDPESGNNSEKGRRAGKSK